MASRSFEAGRKTIITAHRGQMLGQFSDILGSPNNFTRYEGRFAFVTPPVPVSDIQFIFPGWKNSAGEQPLANSFLLDAAVEVDSTFIRLNFAGSSSVTVATGNNYTTDPLPMAFAPNSLIWLRLECIVSAGQTVPSGYQISASGEGAVAGVQASQIVGTGPLATPSGGIVLDRGYGPLAVIGRALTPVPSVALVGDSIFQGLNDAIPGDGNGNYGWVERGLWQAWKGGTVGQYRAVRAGDTLALNTRVNAYRKRLLLQYATHAIFGLGNNDAASSNLAAIQPRLQENWSSAKYRGARVYQALLSPRTTSTDSWATAANQTFVSGFEVGGLRDQVNAWIRTQVGQGLLDGIIDPNTVWEDQANPGKWKSDGTTANLYTQDGIHPVAFSYALAGSQVVAPWAASTLYPNL